MNKDIVRSLMNRNIYTKIKENSSIKRNKKEIGLLKNINGRIKSSERKDININRKKEKSNIIDYSNKLFILNFNLSKHDLFLEKKLEKCLDKEKMMKITILKKISFFDIIKSFFCFKKSKINKYMR